MEHLPKEAPKVSIPPDLERFIDPDRISANARNYPEFNWNPDISEQKALELVRENFLNINLSHATASNPNRLRCEGVSPMSDLAESRADDWRSQTLPLDKSLGLDQYTFMHWGGFYPTQNGRHILSINARDVLLSPDTIVTPHDINSTMFRYMDMEADELPADGKECLHDYLDKIVLGSDWTDIISRRALKRMQTARDPSLYLIKQPGALGEVKYYGKLEPSSINNEVFDARDIESLHPIWRSMVEENGVAVPYITNAIEARDHGYTTSDKDKLPHEIGADIEKSRKLWRKILDIAQSSW